MIIKLTLKQLIINNFHFLLNNKTTCLNFNIFSRHFLVSKTYHFHFINLVYSLYLLRFFFFLLKGIFMNKGYFLIIDTRIDCKIYIETIFQKYYDIYYLNQKWMAGLLTNYKHFRLLLTLYEIRVFLKLLDLDFLRKFSYLPDYMKGIKTMLSLPDLIFLSNITYDKLAYREVSILRLPIISFINAYETFYGLLYSIPGASSLAILKFFFNLFLKLKNFFLMKEIIFFLPSKFLIYNNKKFKKSKNLFIQLRNLFLNLILKERFYLIKYIIIFWKQFLIKVLLKKYLIILIQSLKNFLVKLLKFFQFSEKILIIILKDIDKILNNQINIKNNNNKFFNILIYINSIKKKFVNKNFFLDLIVSNLYNFLSNIKNINKILFKNFKLYNIHNLFFGFNNTFFLYSKSLIKKNFFFNKKINFLYKNFLLKKKNFYIKNVKYLKPNKYIKIFKGFKIIENYKFEDFSDYDFFYKRNYFKTYLNREFFYTFNQNYKINIFLKSLKKMNELIINKTIYYKNLTFIDIKNDQSIILTNYIYSFFKNYFKKFKNFIYKNLFFCQKKHFLYKGLKFFLFHFSNYSYFFKFYRFLRKKFLRKYLFKKFFKKYHIKRYGNAYYLRYYPFQKLRTRRKILLRRLKRWLKRKFFFQKILKIIEFKRKFLTKIFYKNILRIMSNRNYKNGFIDGFFRKFGCYKAGKYFLFENYQARLLQQKIKILKKKLKRFEKYKIKYHKKVNNKFMRRYKNNIIIKFKYMTDELYNKYYFKEQKILKRKNYLLTKLKLISFKALRKKNLSKKLKYNLKKRFILNKIYLYPHLIKISFDKIEFLSTLKERKKNDKKNTS